MLVLPYKTRILCNHRNNSHPSSQPFLQSAFLIAGFIPVSVVNSKIPYAMDVRYSITNKFQRDEEIDRFNLASVTNTTKNEPQVYTEEEEEAINRGKVRLDKENWFEPEEVAEKRGGLS